MATWLWILLGWFVSGFICWGWLLYSIWENISGNDPFYKKDHRLVGFYSYGKDWPIVMFLIVGSIILGPVTLLLFYAAYQNRKKIDPNKNIFRPRLGWKVL